MSIIPGIETAAPERTETSSGSCVVAEALAGLRLEPARCARSISSSRPAGRPPSRMYARHASVVIVKPAGTGTPSCVISARPIPFPPRSSRPPSDGSSNA